MKLAKNTKKTFLNKNSLVQFNILSNTYVI